MEPRRVRVLDPAKPTKGDGDDPIPLNIDISGTFVFPVIICVDEMAPTTIFITGANRGLGKGFLEAFLARPNHVVIAGNRGPNHATSKALFDLPKGEGSKLIVVKIDSTVESDAAAAVGELQTKHGVDHLDIVIANAGIALTFPSVAELKIPDLLRHLTTNTFAVVWLYQATLPLLRKSSNSTAKWITLGSAAGWLENQYPAPNAAYAPSKVAVHWLTNRMNGEEEKLTAFITDPGYVRICPPPPPWLCANPTPVQLGPIRHGQRERHRLWPERGPG